MAKRILFIDRDGTLILEAPPTYQLDSYDKLTDQDSQGAGL
jgi:imidazoleglycerol-phosphate dehydratase/histidinol-phosphatase